MCVYNMYVYIYIYICREREIYVSGLTRPDPKLTCKTPRSLKHGWSAAR